MVLNKSLIPSTNAKWLLWVPGVASNPSKYPFNKVSTVWRPGRFMSYESKVYQGWLHRKTDNWLPHTLNFKSKDLNWKVYTFFWRLITSKSSTKTNLSLSGKPNSTTCLFMYFSSYTASPNVQISWTLNRNPKEFSRNREHSQALTDSTCSNSFFFFALISGRRGTLVKGAWPLTFGPLDGSSPARGIPPAASPTESLLTESPAMEVVFLLLPPAEADGFPPPPPDDFCSDFLLWPPN